MAEIKKKIWPQYFEAVQSGKKKYELRLNDFEISVGDTLILEEWDPDKKDYTGRKIEKKVAGVDRFPTLFWPKEEVESKGLQIISLE